LLLLAGYFLFAFAVIALRYVVLPAIDDYRPALERLVSRQAGVPVRIGAIDANWMGLHPRLVLRDVDVLDAQGRVALALPRIATLFSWRSLLVFEPRLLQLQLEAPHIDIRRDRGGRIWVAGVSFDPHEPGSHEASRWLLAQRDVSMRGGTVRWLDEMADAPALDFHDVAFRLRNNGRRHRAALLATPPPALASTIDVRAEFSHRLFETQPTDMTRWRGTIYGNADFIDLLEWRSWLPLSQTVLNGYGALRGWADFRDGRVHHVLADVALHDLDLQLVHGHPALPLRDLVARVDAGKDASGHRVTLTHPRMQIGAGEAMTPGTVTASYAADTDAGELRMPMLSLGALRDMAPSLPLPEATRTRIAQAQPAGRLDDVILTWQGDPLKVLPAAGGTTSTASTPAVASAPGVPLASASRAGDFPLHTFHLQTRFSGLSLTAAPVPTGKDVHHAQRPGVTNLSGTLDAGPRAATLSIDASDLTLTLPGVFAAPLVPVQRLVGDIRIDRPEQGPMTVTMSKVEFEQARNRGHVQATWTARGRTPAGSLDLSGQLTRADPRDVHRFIPTVVPDDVRVWLRNALLAGTASDVDFRVKGDLADFPYGDGKVGEFHVAGKFQGVTLEAAGPAMGKPDIWPRIDDIAGDFVFDRVSMALRTRGGKVRTAPDSSVILGESDVRIAHLEKAPLLELDTEARGTATDFLRFVRETPLARMGGQVLNDASATGNLVVPLSLRLPLEHVDFVRVEGDIQLAGNTFRFNADSPPLSRLAGTLHFSNDGISPKDVTGTLLEGPVTLSGGPGANGVNELVASGTVPARGLQTLWPAPGMTRLSGQAAYRATVQVATGKPPRAVIESTLQGLGLDLPVPLRKAPADSLPLRAEWGPQEQAGANGDWLAASVGGSLVNLHIERDLTLGSGQLRGLRGALGVNRAATLSGPGFGLAIDLPVLDVDRWRTVMAEFVSPAPAPVATALDPATARLFSLNRVNLKTGSLQLHGRHLDNVTLYAARQGAAPPRLPPTALPAAQPAQVETGDWRVDIDSDQVAGRLSWNEGPDGIAGKLTARLRRLVVQDEPGAGDGSDIVADPKPVDVPEVDLIADRFDLYGKSLGRLEVQAQTVDRGLEWQLRHLTVKNDDATLDGSGVWRVEPGDNRTTRRRMTLDASLDLVDTGKFLDRMGLPATIAGGAGRVNSKVSWLGMPYSIDMPTLSGTVELDIGKGQFLKADPGIAKLLGVLSLQSLPRRVSLDFRDVFSEGFAFDSLRGNAAIRSGVAHTEDFRMNGISATVMMAGDTDLVHETQKLRVVVVPKLDAGGATLLYGLVNPVLGLSMFVAQLLLREPLGAAFTYQYGISGSWADPVIARISNATPRPGPVVDEPVPAP
jgi:uncharacterized protein (TIGR02099 family)